MLKGTTTIELTDVNTGKTETYKDENIVTNALAEIVKPLGLVKSASKIFSTFAPYYQNLLSGILLFDNNIDENPNDFYAPANANLIACGVYGEQNNTTGTLRGGYNTIESEFNSKSKYMKYVYDFTTTQGNGTINSVCLTHKNAGYNGYGGKDAVIGSLTLGVQVCDGVLQYVRTSYTGANTGDKYSGFTLATTEQIFLIDVNQDVVYYFRIDTTSKITIIKRKAYLKSVSILENIYYEKPYIEEQSILFDEPLLSSSWVTYNFDNTDKCLYIVSSSSSTVVAGGTFQVMKIKLDTWEITYYTATNTTDTTLTAIGRFAYAHNGYILLKAFASPGTPYKFEIGNWANVVDFKLTGMTTFTGSPALAINNRVYYETYISKLEILNMENLEVLTSECNKLTATPNPYQWNYTPILDESMLWYYSLGSLINGGFMMMANYLATINNLAEPVTKTVDKTMKITYTIQEV